MDYLNKTRSELEELGFRLWNQESGIMLIPLSRFQDVLDSVPPGTILYDIFGKECPVGTHHFDDDTRGGLVAYGIKVKEFDSK